MSTEPQTGDYSTSDTLHRKATHTGQMPTRSVSDQIDTHITAPVNTATNSRVNTQSRDDHGEAPNGENTTGA